MEGLKEGHYSKAKSRTADEKEEHRQFTDKELSPPDYVRQVGILTAELRRAQLTARPLCRGLPALIEVCHTCPFVPAFLTQIAPVGISIKLG